MKAKRNAGNLPAFEPITSVAKTKGTPKPGCIARAGRLLAAAFIFLVALAFIGTRESPKPLPAPATTVPTAAMRVLVTAPATDTPLPTVVLTDTATLTLTMTNTDTPTPEPATAAPTQYRLTLYAGAGGANLRTCAQTDCEARLKLAPGEAMTAYGQVDGQAVNVGNTVWYQVQRESEALFVYSGVVGTTPPAAPAGQNAPVSSGGSSSVNQAVSANPGAVCVGFDMAVCSQYNTPRTCATAVADGIPSQTIACCFPARDSDHDGNACYGN